MDFEQVEAVFRRLAIEAGTRIMEIYEADDFDVRSKSDESPVTEADEAADALISAGLRGDAPELFAIVDPLDGTKEFVKRRGDFTVNIALVQNGVPIRGVVYAPARGRLFYTDATGKSVEETGPFDPASPGETGGIGVSAEPDNGALLVVASKSHRDAATDDYIGKYDVSDMRSAGSSLKFCLVATGEADIYPRLGRTMEWDTAAGDAVLRGAGGRMVRFDDHSAFVYGKPGYENPFFIAYAPGVTLRPA